MLCSFVPVKACGYALNNSRNLEGQIPYNQENPDHIASELHSLGGEEPFVEEED